tara:strand:+ start:92 stop:631 length:540 start_codon:yes stop_codon:yes gene_type:complete
MSEQEVTQDEKHADDQIPVEKKEAGSGTDKAEDYNVPGYRFRELNEKNKALQDELKALHQASKAREEKEAEEREEYKTLYEKIKAERDSLAVDAEKFNSIETARKDRLLESFPEKLREKLSNLDSETLDVMKDEFTNKVPKVDESDGGVSGGKPANWSKLAPSERKKHFADIVSKATRG